MMPSGVREPLKLEVAQSYEAMSRRAEQIILRELEQRPDLILCASAGGTPTRSYELLAASARRDPQAFRKIRVLQIDEWGGLAPHHPATCDQDLRVKLLEPLGISKNRYIGFNTAAADPEAECSRVAQWLATNGPIDVCVLGLGVNGHIAMNEPADCLLPHAHVAKLTHSSMRHPMLRASRQKPRFGLTLGMADILCSRHVLLLVNGTHKREAIDRLRHSPVTTRFPASFLWLHPRATILCDREAARGGDGSSPRARAKSKGRGNGPSLPQSLPITRRSRCVDTKP